MATAHRVTCGLLALSGLFVGGCASLPRKNSPAPLAATVPSPAEIKSELDHVIDNPTSARHCSRQTSQWGRPYITCEFHLASGETIVFPTNVNELGLTENVRPLYGEYRNQLQIDYKVYCGGWSRYTLDAEARSVTCTPISVKP